MKLFTEKQVTDLQKSIETAMKSFDLSQVKANEDGSNTFKVVASDESVDRHGEIIKVDGWILDNYMKNPIIAIDHKTRSIEHIAGKATKVYIEDEQLVVEGVFTDATDAGKIAKALYEGGFLKTVSVGLLVKSRDENNENIITSAELYELSFVAVPANPNAISLDEKSIKKAEEVGLIKAEEEKEEDPVLTRIDALEEKIDNIISLLDGKSNEDNESDKGVLDDLSSIVGEKKALQVFAKFFNEEIAKLKKA